MISRNKGHYFADSHVLLFAVGLRAHAYLCSSRSHQTVPDLCKIMVYGATKVAPYAIPLGVFLAAAGRVGPPLPPPPLPPSPPWLATAGQKWLGGKFGQFQGKRRKNGHTWGP